MGDLPAVEIARAQAARRGHGRSCKAPGDSCIRHASPWQRRWASPARMTTRPCRARGGFPATPQHPTWRRWWAVRSAVGPISRQRQTAGCRRRYRSRCANQSAAAFRSVDQHLLDGARRAQHLSAVDRWVGPSFTTSLTFERPFGNNRTAASLPNAARRQPVPPDRSDRSQPQHPLERDRGDGHAGGGRASAAKPRPQSRSTARSTMERSSGSGRVTRR